MYCETESRLAGKEMELGSIMARTVSNALKAFDLPTPKSCFIWRDGVGDTAVTQVAGQEIPAVRAALGSTGKVVGAADANKANVPLTYTVCQKRINTKLLTKDGNKVPCGALVTGLQGSEHKTFYINGTSPPYSTPKPIRFIMAERDEELNCVSVSELSWCLAHNYPNWFVFFSDACVCPVRCAPAELHSLSHDLSQDGANQTACPRAVCPQAS